jgi:hypothetical protein
VDGRHLLPIGYGGEGGGDTPAHPSLPSVSYDPSTLERHAILAALFMVCVLHPEVRRISRVPAPSGGLLGGHDDRMPGHWAVGGGSANASESFTQRLGVAARRGEESEDRADPTPITPQRWATRHPDAIAGGKPVENPWGPDYDRRAAVPGPFLWGNNTDPMTHPAIKRGYYEAQTFRVVRLADDGTVEFDAPIPLLLRVVRPDLDMALHLRNGGAHAATEEGKPFGSVDLVRTVAPFLREGLVDPGNGRVNPTLPPVHVVHDGQGLTFVQVAACLN